MSLVRRAVEDDVAELIRLRALLFETLGGEFFNPVSADDAWRDAFGAVLKEQLTADTMRILVVDGDDGLAACGIGTIEQWLPGPHLRNGRIGHVIGMVTDPAYRRRGYGRAIIQRLLDWFREREVARVDLHASPAAEPLYRAHGFVDHPDPSLCWRP
jgi:GNAT superfamily N-acetyltransferase